MERALQKQEEDPWPALKIFENLITWQKGMDLAVAVYRVVETFPRSELYALGNQLRRAVGSIPANVAEGFSRRSRGVYRAHVFSIALGSHAEVRTQIELARRLGFISDDVAAELQDRGDEVGRLLHGLWRSLAIKDVCYAVGLTGLLIGLWPWALGLFNAIARLP
jgi:four helix bundle protein